VISLPMRRRPGNLGLALKAGRTSTRNVGQTHAGGVVDLRDKLTDFAPLYCDEAVGVWVNPSSTRMMLEAAGLVKFEFLGCAP